MRQLMHGFGADTTPRRRWQEMARKRAKELETQMAQLKAMRRLVDRVLNCQCAELADCGRMASSVIAAAK